MTTLYTFAGDKTMKVVDHASKDDLQVVAIGMLAYCTQDPRDPNIVVYATRTADTRLNVIIGHVFTVQVRPSNGMGHELV